MSNYNAERLINKKVDFIDKGSLNFKSGDYTFLKTNDKWRAGHTLSIDYKSARKDVSKDIQTLKRSLPKSERKDFKYIIVPEFNKSGKQWQLGFHIIVNKLVNLSLINNFTGEIQKIKDIERILGYFTKSFYITLGSELGHNIRVFSNSHNVK